MNRKKQLYNLYTEMEAPRTPVAQRFTEQVLFREYTTPKRSAVIAAIRARNEAPARFPRLSNDDIFKVHGVSRRTGYNWLRNGSERRTGRDRPGRKKLLTNELMDDVESFLEDNGWPGRISHWEEICDYMELPVGARALRNAAHRRGLYKFKAAQTKYLHEEDVRRRLEFCRLSVSYAINYWRSVRFTDECHVSLGARNAEWVIRRRGERFLPEAMQFKKKRKSAYFHLWAIVGYNFKSTLVFYGEGVGTGNISMRRYIDEILERHILPIYLQHRARGDDFVLKHDNDAGHGTRSKKNIVQDWIGRAGLPRLFAET